MVKWMDEHLTVAMPHELYERVKKHKEVKWSVIARESIIKYLEKIEAMDQKS